MGARSKDNARTPNVCNWGSFAHQERGKEEEEKKETEISQMEKGIQKKAK